MIIFFSMLLFIRFAGSFDESIDSESEKEMLLTVLGFILKKKSAPTEMDEIRENLVQFRAEFGEFSEIESQNSFRT